MGKGEDPVVFFGLVGNVGILWVFGGIDGKVVQRVYGDVGKVKLVGLVFLNVE